MRFFGVLAAAAAALAVAAIAAILLLAPRGVEVVRLDISGPSGRRIAADLWSPTGRRPAGGVLVCHGVETNKEVMAPLASELARRGFIALAFDYGGYGESDWHSDELELMVQDSQAALGVLALQVRAAGGSGIAAVGHSMGATYAVELARRAEGIAAVVALGNEPVAPDVPPRNVAWGLGLYDAFHTLDAMLEVLRESTGAAAVEPDRVLGSHADGSARSLITSPLSDHGIEPLDPVLIAATARWVEQALPAGAPIAHAPVTAPYRAAAHMVLFLAGVLLLTALVVLLGARFAGGSAASIIPRAYLAVVGVAALGGNLAGPHAALVWADVSLAALAGGSIAAALLAGAPHPRPLDRARSRLRLGAGMLGLGAACLLVGLFAGGLPAAVRLGQAAAAPGFLLHILLLRPFEGLGMLRAYAFASYSEAWVPGVGLSLILAVELVRPGLVTTVVARALHALLAALELRGPLRLRASRRELAAAAAAFGVLAYFLVRRFSEGWLTWEAIERMGSISLRFMILPLALFILALNLIRRRVGRGAG